jgi:hypothetical protein
MAGGVATADVSASPSVNDLAVASFAFSVVGLAMGIFLAIAPVVGLILGCIALRKTRSSSVSRGRGFAVAGVIIGIVGSAWWLYVWVMLITHNLYGH